jgi:hypothetical protein
MLLPFRKILDMNPNNLGCLINGHRIVERDTPDSVRKSKMPDYPFCIGCHRRIIWWDGKFILIRPYKR